jgi:phage shock protein E
MKSKEYGMQRVVQKIMQRMTLIKLPVVLLFLLLTACSSMGDMQSTAVDPMDADVVWIDVRTLEEYQNDHIDGDLNIPIQGFSAATVSEQLGLDKDAKIGLYCAGGGRAGRALIMLEEAGFTKAFNAGGISDAREQRGL